MEYEIKCSKCGSVSSSLLDFKCQCGSPFETHLHLNFEKGRVHKRDYTVWRYADFFPYVKRKEVVSLGEGWTPIIRSSHNLYFKLDYLNPTGSFKDRGSTVLISSLQKSLKEDEGYLSEDSSGNAGASIAAYATRAGLRAKIYVPESVSGQKFNQTLFYGAEVVKVSGGRSKVTEEAQKPEENKFYVGHVLHPLFRDGMRSLAYELAEQFKWRLPGYIFVPVSAGTLLLGLISGLLHLQFSGIIDSVPKVVACQTRQVSPLYHKFKHLEYVPPKTVNSVADALASVNPPLLELMIQSLKKIDGNAVLVEENEIIDSFKELAKKGLLVEPSSAVAYAAYKKQIESGEVPKQVKTVVVLTGIGLKILLNFAK